MTNASEERLLLLLTGDARAGAELPRQGVLTIGSSSDRSGFVVEGEGVDGVHCAIARAKGGGWALKDLGSARGTLLNGRRVEVARISAGDRIQIGSRELRIVAPVESGPSSGPPDPAGHSSETKAFEPGEGVESPVDSFGESSGSNAALPAFSGYRVERKIGRGGMGSVYLAVQTNLDRPVALKVLAPRLSDDREFVRRFQAEARAAAALAHPNVVTVYDVGEENGLHFLSMEYMDRGTLEERVARSGRLSWPETLDVLRDAAAGLVYAEGKRIVHRDLKPANLMQNHVGATKIADLGLATHIEAEEQASADKKVFGTPHFMSPEQARGERVDGRSDLYSLGATAYRLLTGHTPFEGTNAREIVRAHLTLDPRPMRDFAPDLPDAALELVARLMQKDPGLRYGSAAELLREIEHLRTRGLVPARPAAGKRLRTALVVSVLVLLGAGAWWLDRTRPWEEPVGPSRPTEVVARNAPPLDASSPAPEPGTSTADGTTSPLAPEVLPADDDKALQLLEANARVALLELMGQEMRPAEKRDALRALALLWRGTSAASEALERADKIQGDLETRAAADVERLSRIDELVARMETAAGLDKMPPRPGTGLLNMRAVPGQEAVFGDPAFQERKRELERALIGRAAAFARSRLEQIALKLEQGDFETVQGEMAELMPVFELPDFPPGEGPGGVAELFEIGRTARERLKNLEYLEGQYVDRQVRDDTLAIAEGLRGSSSLESDIRALDLPAAKERLVRLEGRIATKEARELVGRLRTDIEAADLALRTLGREFSKWRRRSFSVPNHGSAANRNAVGADDQGILAESGSGTVEHLPWSAFGGDDRELSKLFVERLTRDWSPEEARGIAALIRMTAVVEVVARASKMFDANRRFNFTDADEREMSECFVQAQVWAEKSGTKDLLAREMEAARRLTLVCRKITDKAWATAVVLTEELLSRDSDTLLVRLLSDGTIPEKPDPPKSKD